MALIITRQADRQTDGQTDGQTGCFLHTPPPPVFAGGGGGNNWSFAKFPFQETKLVKFPLCASFDHDLSINFPSL